MSRTAIATLVVLAMLTLAIGPYLLDRTSRPARTTVTTGLSV